MRAEIAVKRMMHQPPTVVEKPAPGQKNIQGGAFHQETAPFL
jgi:hypothetical protein